MLIISFACLALLVFGLIIVFNYGENIAETIAISSNWGLSFQQEGKMPIGNVSAEFLKKYDAYYVLNGEEKVIYLTFDAGFENGYTTKILDVLKKHNIKSTFFLVGNYLETEPELVKRMINEGHIIGNHTYTHPDMSKISDVEVFKKELIQFEEKYKSLTNQELIKFYRPPQGKFSEDNLKHAQHLGYKTFFWSLAYVDWYVNDQPAKEQAFKKLIPRIHPGAIVLLHSTSKTNADIMDELITKWKELGYSFKNLNEIK
jgi:peptidoglycan-N-acetylmuramic acid deacetylase